VLPLLSSLSPQGFHPNHTRFLLSHTLRQFHRSNNGQSFRYTHSGKTRPPLPAIQPGRFRSGPTLSRICCAKSTAVISGVPERMSIANNSASVKAARPTCVLIDFLNLETTFEKLKTESIFLQRKTTFVFLNTLY